MAHFKYDPTRVRAGFRRQYCRELDLPSGKPSGFEIFTITDEEINSLMGDFNVTPKLNNEITTISEWMLWGALRLKYGINYLNPKPKALRWQTYEPHYVGDKEPTVDEKLELLENRTQGLIDQATHYFTEKVLEKINDGQKSAVKTMFCMGEDYKKYFKK